MTVREFVQQILLNSPDLDATVYIQKREDALEYHDFDIIRISDDGSSDGLFIELEDWKP